MKKIIFALIATMLALTACTPAVKQNSASEAVLLVKVGESQKSFSVEDLQALPGSEVTFKDVTYKGVTISALLEAMSVDPSIFKAFKAVAADGYSVNYDPAQILKDDVLVAYTLADGSPLSADDGNFRMVLPGAEGKLNIRMVVELQIIQ